jgi:hypothetical protein
MQHLIELDSRRRLALGKLGKPEHTRYLVDEQPDGTLVLTPAVVMRQHEAGLIRNPALVARLEAELADPSKWVRHSAARRPRSTERQVGSASPE